MPTTTESTTVLYADATAHYLSPGRRDPVKRHWEEPFSQWIFMDAIERIPFARRRDLRVLDIGSGTGDGLDLLERARAKRDDMAQGDRTLNYLGIDVDPQMVETSRRLHDGRDEVDFVCADVRDGVPSDPFDVYLSCGVPYSHLTPAETSWVLTDIFSVVRRNATTSVVVLDVLGRYSIEWMPKWGSSRWLYSMNFFEDADNVIQVPMTFHSRQSLSSCIRDAAWRSGVEPLDVAYYDRSIAVGRHTATRAYNKEIQPLRTLVNRLYDGSPDVDIEKLLLEVKSHLAPAQVSRFFNRFITTWNDRVQKSMSEIERGQGEPGRQRIELANSLRRIEYERQPGLGVGHSLIAVVHVDGRRPCVPGGSPPAWPESRRRGAA